VKVLVTGKNGQLGYELTQTLPEGITAVFYDSAALDITNVDIAQKVLEREKPDVVINAAAYTAVDKAETEQEQAFMVNQQGCENLANACASINAKLATF